MARAIKAPAHWPHVILPEPPWQGKGLAVLVLESLKGGSDLCRSDVGYLGLPGTVAGRAG